MIIKLIVMAISFSIITACALTLFIACLQLNKNGNWRKFVKWVYLCYSIPIASYVVFSLILSITK